MTSINKQKFLAELGKLLTFMYEEDRQRAMELYIQMFRDVTDETALLQQLVSPTRQAVIVARAYNANLGKLSVYSKAAPEDRDENGVPDYVQAIERVREQAWTALGIPTESAEETAAEDHAAGETVEEAPAEQAAEEPAEPAETAETPEDAPQSEEESVGKDRECPAEATEEEAVEEAAEEAAEETAGEAAEETAGEAAEETAEELAEEPKEEAAEENAVEELQAHSAAERGREQGFEFFTLPEKEELPDAHEIDTALEEKGFNVNSEPLKKSVRKPKVFLLIVYILLAIPITIVGIALLLIPAMLFLALSVAAFICGVVLVSAALKGFPVFADIMVLLGVALVLFALGLLFLWTAIWFIGGAVVGLVHGVAVLCDKWCYEEVSEG